jgi:flagellar motor switch protein FliM
MTEDPDPTPSFRAGATARIVAAHRRGVAEARDRTPELSRAFDRALRHAAVPFRGLGLRCGDIAVVQDAPLSRALEDLPRHGLVAVLEDREGQRGLIALSHTVVDALIEVQTTGRVEPQELAPRPVTRIDEALSRDFLDLALAAFARETEGLERRDWPDRMTYGSGIGDRAQLPLLLPERGFHLLSAEVQLGEGVGRRGQISLTLPAIPSEAAATAAAVPPDTWRTDLAEALSSVDIPLEAVLCRILRPLHEVEALAPGDLLHFEADDLAAVSLEAAGGRRALAGRLGQAGGRRALKIAADVTEGGAAAPGLDSGASGLPATAPAPGPLALGNVPEMPRAPGDKDLPSLPADASPEEGPVEDPSDDLTPTPAPMPLDFAPQAIDPDVPAGGS